MFDIKSKMPICFRCEGQIPLVKLLPAVIAGMCYICPVCGNTQGLELLKLATITDEMEHRHAKYQKELRPYFEAMYFIIDHREIMNKDEFLIVKLESARAIINEWFDTGMKVMG